MVAELEGGRKVQLIQLGCSSKQKQAESAMTDERGSHFWMLDFGFWVILVGQQDSKMKSSDFWEGRGGGFRGAE